jgi:hypothetical protein
VLAKNVLNDWSGTSPSVVHDSSTAALIEKLRD